MGKQRRLKAERRDSKRHITKSKNRLTRWVVAGAISFVGAGIGGYALYDNYYTKNTPIAINSREIQNRSLDNLVTQSQLKTARKDPAKRQHHLNQLLEGIKIPYCSEVVYDHDGSKILEYVRSEMLFYGTPSKEISQIIKSYESIYKGGYYDTKTPEILQLSGMNRSSKIFVGRRMYEDFVNLEDSDLKHIFVAHESQHCLQHAKGLGYLDKNLLLDGVANGLIEKRVIYEIAELDANYHGLKRIFSGEFKVGKAYFEDTKNQYIQNHSRLHSVLKSSSYLQRKFILAAFEGVKDLDFHGK